VADAFTDDHAQQYGIKPLSSLCNISRELFKDKKPAELLTGRHTFVDPDGDEHVLDFQADHTVQGLKNFISAARDTKDQLDQSAQSGDEEVKAIALALQAAAKAGEGVVTHVHERRKKKIEVEVMGEADDVRAVLKAVAAELDRGVATVPSGPIR